MTHFTRFCAALLAATLLNAGCQQPAAPEGPTLSQIQDDDLQSYWDATLAVLLRHDFQPDRQDRAQGVITTFPTAGKQWGEFWRQDIAGSYSLAESSLHTVQRQVTVRFIRDKQWTVRVQVDVYRLNVPEAQITTASSAFQVFSGVLPTTEGEPQLHGEAKRGWVHLGRDAAMETRLLDRILARAA